MVRYHVDFMLASKVYNTDFDFNVYSVSPPLIYQGFESKGSDIATLQHPLINYPLSKIKVAETMSFEYWNNVRVFYLRKFGVPITIFFLTMLIISLIVGLVSSEKVVYYFIIFVIGLYIIEIIITKGKFIKTMMIELLVILLVTLTAFTIKKNIKN